MTDAQILEAMRNQQEAQYMIDTTHTDNYEECLKYVQKDARIEIKFLAYLAKEVSEKYGYDLRTIIDEMIYPEIEAEVYNENR